MFQEARRYLPALPGGLRGRSFLRYEVPDTTFFALVGTTFNLLNGTTGPGLLALPLAFARCGWLLGSMLLLLVFVLNNTSLLFLLKSCLATREHSYIGLAYKTGESFAALVDWASLLFFFGSCVSYLVIIGDTFTLVTSTFGEGPFYAANPGGGGVTGHYSLLSLLILTAFTTLCLAPLSMLRSMDSLQVTSTIAMVCIFYAVGVVLCVGPGVEPGADAAADGVSEIASPAVAFHVSAETLITLPTMAFCFSSQSLFPPALETLHQPATYHHLHTVVSVTMYLTFLLHLAVGLAGYLRFGGQVGANILDSLPQTGPVMLARLAIVIAFAFTFPMMIFLCRTHLQSILARGSRAKQQTDDPGPAPPREDHHRLISALLVGGSLLSAVLFPNIDLLFGILGGTTAVVISFVAPAVFWEQFVGYMYPWSHPRKLTCKLLLVFSFLVAALALPGLLVDVIGDLYATAWWVPMASNGMSSWSGGLELLEKEEIAMQLAQLRGANQELHVAKA